MEKDKAKFIAFGFVVVGFFLILIALTTGTALIGFNNPTSTPEYKVVCTGTADTDLFSANDFEDVSCGKQKCGLIEFSILSGTEQEGKVRMFVDGQLQKTKSFSTLVGTSTGFNIEGQCVSDPQKVRLELLNEKGNVDDTFEEVFT